MNRKILKPLGLFLVLLTISTTGFSQVHKLKSVSFSSRYKINDYNWSAWSESSESSVLITFNLTNDRITIYSEQKQVYDIVEYEGKTTDSEGDDIFSYYCVDNDGLTCRVKWLQLNSQNGRMQMYVYYSDINWLYNIYPLD
jgi:hypothetical protein